MLTIYRWHTKECPDKSKARGYRLCRCPIWVPGLLDTEEVRESLKTLNWDKAQQTASDWEVHGRRTTKEEGKPISDTCGAYLADAAARNLQEDTLAKYRPLFKSLEAFAKDQGFRYLTEINLDLARQFRATWPNTNQSAGKKLERLRVLHVRGRFQVNHRKSDPQSQEADQRLSTYVAI